MLIARTDLNMPGGEVLKKGAVVPPGAFAEPEPYVRMGKLWRIDDEALAFAVEHLAKQGETKASGGKRR